MVDLPDIDFADIRHADDVSRAIAALYGGVELRPSPGVLHVTAVWQPASTEPTVTLKINDATPKSDHDFFVLNLARARADAILVTGKILREEPSLRYDLQGPAAPALAEWRHEVLGKREPPLLAVLTSGRGLDVGHPAFHSWARPLVFTSAPIDVADVEVVTDPQAGARRVIEQLQHRGARTISVEAGPSVSVPLYDDPSVVDELMLSIFAGPSIPESVRGGAFVPRDRIDSLLAQQTPVVSVSEPSGLWRFQRLWRRE